MRRRRRGLPPRAEEDPVGPWDDSIADAFELLVSDPPSAEVAAARPLRAEEIGWERCSYCSRPARSSIFEITRRVRVLLCDACRPVGVRSSPSTAPTG